MTTDVPSTSTLVRPGKGAVLVLDEATLAALGIDQDTPVRMTVAGRKLIVEAEPQDSRSAAFRAAMVETVEENAELFRRLAK